MNEWKEKRQAPEGSKGLKSCHVGEEESQEVCRRLMQKMILEQWHGWAFGIGYPHTLLHSTRVTENLV